MIIEKPKIEATGSFTHKIEHKCQQSSSETAKMIQNPQSLIPQKTTYPERYSQDPSFKNENDQQDENLKTINTPKVNDLESPIKLETKEPKKQIKFKQKDQKSTKKSVS